MIWALSVTACGRTRGGHETFAHCLRHVLFMGLSDGARTDLLRYAARGTLTNEQVVGFTQIDSDKWQELLDDLRKDSNNQQCSISLPFCVGRLHCKWHFLVTEADP